MLILNLANQALSHVSYLKTRFPDGQQAITLIDGFSGNFEVTIISRMNSFSDLELIICANQALKELGYLDIRLYVPYFLGARSDRKFIDGTCNYLKTVICPIINQQEFTKVIVLDPHSDVLEACLDNFSKLTNDNLVKSAIDDIAKSIKIEDLVVVSPDAGSLKKIHHNIQHLKLLVSDLIIASKHRDLLTGNITHTTVPISGWHKDKAFILIDDICDGGRTFIEIAKVIRAQIENARIYLVVSHGIFSAGLLPLLEFFDKIYTTDSVKSKKVLTDLDNLPENSDPRILVHVVTEKI
jgi:ribose-phosphate pyrophosphokinase